jgi:YD repeat-containing protein
MRSKRKPLESRHGRKVGDPLPPKEKASTDGAASDSERFVSDDARVNRMAVRRDHTLTARSLSVAHETNFAPANLMRVASLRGLANHAAFDFLRYPSLHSETYLTSNDELHLAVRSAGLTSRLGVSIRTEAAELFVPAMPQSGPSKIVFATNRDGSMQIYVMNGDGSAVTRLTYSGANDDYPRWSPNGSKILFQSDRDHPDTGYMDIYVMNSDGGGVTRLTTDANDDSMASWSGDGSKIVFQSMRNGVNYQVYSMNADGSNQVNLTNTSASDGEPSWSSDGTKIAFASDRDHAGFDSVYVMNSNGSGQHAITSSGATVDDTQPIWSHDGSKIAFVSTRDSTTETWQETDDDGNYITKSKLHINKEVYLMNADGSGQTRLTNDLANDDAPSWSPDGSKIVFRSDRERDCCDPSAQVWTMNTDGTGQTDVSNDGAGNYTASWASGSGNLVPVANAGGTYSGTLSQNVPFNGGNSYDPDGTIISYSWTFGDGGTGSGVGPTHAYSGTGTYTVTLTVTDNFGAQGSASSTVSISSSSSDQFAQNFLQLSLARAPNGTESSYWTDIMRAAYAQGQTSMLYAVREFGMTVFESGEYAVRNRTDHEYVYDLYKTYLMREPDSDGWGFWTSQVPSMGREGVRHAFDGCYEFSQIVATLTASGAASSAVASLPTAHVDPFNLPGNQLRGRDCEWSLPLLSLPGRAGLDLGLGLSYSSAVWTRSGPYIYFDADMGLPSPGFKLGFPTIRGPFFDAQVGRNAYLLITGSGRTELRQAGTTNIYEAADSSYLQLTAGGSLTLRATDGTVMSYAAFEDEWHCTAIEDRNGNLINISYDKRDITTITDTLARTLTFNYDVYANLSTITQTWNGQSHTWASFGWSNLTMQPGFSPEVVGTYNGEVIPVMTQVGLADGSRYNFEYTTNGQVNMIRRYTSDNVQRSYMAYNYDAPAADCPRITASRVWAENWTGVNGVPVEVVTSFSDNGDGSHQMIAPDGTIYKELYAGSSQPAWMHGLVTQSVVLSDSTQQKVTTTAWTQDNTSVNYQTNPRVIESNIYDANGNRRRTTIDYSPSAYAQYGLPYFVSEYAADGQTEIRRSYNDYNLSQLYLDRRIIGLISARHVYNPSTGEWLSKATYGYDASGINPEATYAPGHDQNYDASFTPRGNVTSISRWDVTDIGNGSKALTTQMTYDAAGNVLSTTDPSSHTNSISYADSFSDGNNSRGTFAYPTTVTDADGYQSLVQYSFDFGAKTQVQGPPQPNGLVQAFSYDNAARLLRVTTVNTGAYTHYYYGPNYLQSYSSVNTVAANYWQSDQYEVKVFDGAGRVFEAASYHPGSQGGYLAVWTQFDQMGRVTKQSNPTEISGNWTPYGDDAIGWVFPNATVYDWKGRATRAYNTDGTYKEASYEGCGCAGGAVSTLTDEIGRQQKIYSDVFGRQLKTAVLNWDGSVYSTRVLAYNARDQITSAKQYQGTDSSGVYQEETKSYDGYGRLATRKAPIQTTATAYTYFANDKPQTMTDARGATTTYSYNNRGLVNGISFSGVSPTPGSISYTYDGAGNRITMTDETGNVSYQYDSLSRLLSETKQFSGSNAPSGNYALGYGYNYAGELTAITDPTGSRVDYGFDSTGRLTSVTGSGVNSAPTYAANFAYRAWGAIKDFDFGNGLHQHLNFNSRLQNTSLALSNVNSIGTMTWNYDYYNDGKLLRVTDSAAPNFDRFFDYDHEGRMSNALTGTEARGGTTADGPFKQSYGYDVWENTTSRTFSVWAQGTQSENVSYPNNRHQNWGYDNAGDATATYDANLGYDAAGQNYSYSSNIMVGSEPALTVAQTFDGNSAPVQKTETRKEDPNAPAAVTSTFYLRSTALGGKVVAELDSTGYKRVGHIYAGGMEIATQTIWNPGYGSQMSWKSTNPATGSEYSTDSSRNLGRQELDPLGADVTSVPTNPLVVGDPVFYDSKFDHMPIAYEGGQTEDAQIPDWYLHMAYASWDEHLAQGYWQSKHYDLAAEVVRNNPNVGVEYNIVGFGHEPRAGSIFGAQAADFLNALGAMIENGTLVQIGAPGSSRGGDRRYDHAQNPSEPQGTFDAAYQSCGGTLGNSTAPGLAQAADILMVANRTGVDPTLLSVTWRFEGGLDQYGQFNFQPTNGMHTPSTQTGDVGPGQLYPDTWNKTPYTDGLTNPFGTNLNRGQVFNGNAFESLMVAGRALGTAQGAQRANAAGLYRAGSSTNPGYKERVQNFKDNVKNYDAFFGCLAKKGFSP